MSYPRYNGYNVTNLEVLAEIPSHWSLSKVKYVAKYLNGAAFKPEDWGDEGIRIVRIQNLTDPTAEYNRTSIPVQKRYLLSRGDILISWSASLGVYVWLDDEPAWLNQHIFKASPHDHIVDSSFFIWLA